MRARERKIRTGKKRGHNIYTHFTLSFSFAHSLTCGTTLAYTLEFKTLCCIFHCSFSINRLREIFSKCVKIPFFTHVLRQRERISFSLFLQHHHVYWFISTWMKELEECIIEKTFALYGCIFFNDDERWKF